MARNTKPARASQAGKKSARAKNESIAELVAFCVAFHRLGSDDALDDETTWPFYEKSNEYLDKIIKLLPDGLKDDRDASGISNLLKYEVCTCGAAFDEYTYHHAMLMALIDYQLRREPKPALREAA